MAGGVGVFGAESRPESIDIAQAHGIHFAVKLPRNRQVRLFAEKILRIINITVRQPGRIFYIERGYLKHLARPFTVRTGNQRGMDITEAAFIEKFMNSI